MGEWLQQFVGGLGDNFRDLSDAGHVGQFVGRVLLAAVLGAALGYERERHGKAAGVRTHTLVALAAAFFVIVPQRCGATPADLTRVVQGLAAGVGFLGAGAILKPPTDGWVHGLTTAAGIYFTTAVGVATGLGLGTTATLATGLALAVLDLFPRLQHWVETRLGIPPIPHEHSDRTQPPPPAKTS